MYILEIKIDERIQVGDTVILLSDIRQSEFIDEAGVKRKTEEAVLAFDAPRHIKIDRAEVRKAQKTGRKPNQNPKDWRLVKYKNRRKRQA